MRGRKPGLLKIAPGNLPILQQIARSQTRPWYQVQRARIVLAVAAGELIKTVASQWRCNPFTIWRISRRYEQAEVGRYRESS